MTPEDYQISLLSTFVLGFYKDSILCPSTVTTQNELTRQINGYGKLNAVFSMKVC
jgi:hypothetical protein